MRLYKLSYKLNVFYANNIHNNKLKIAVVFLFAIIFIVAAVILGGRTISDIRERIMHARFERYIKTLHPVVFYDTAEARDILSHLEARLISERGFGVTAITERQGFAFRFYFHNDINVNSLEIRNAIEYFTHTFSRAHQIFPSRRYFHTVNIMVDREWMQYSRVRPSPPLGDGRLISERLFTSLEGVTGRLVALFVDLYFIDAIPMWFASGLEDYFLQSTCVSYIEALELTQWLYAHPHFGDIWFVRRFNEPEAIEMARNIAYTLVRRWSSAGILFDMAEALVYSRYALEDALASYIKTLTQHNLDAPGRLFFYHFGDFEVSTPQGIYFFKTRLTLSREELYEYIEYMDAGSIFTRDLFQVGDERKAVTHIHPGFIPFDFYRIPNTEHRNFLRYGFAIGNIAVWPMGWRANHVHEIVHVYLDRVGFPPVWLVEGMAMMGEVKWRYYEYNPLPTTNPRSSLLDELVVQNRMRSPLWGISRHYPESIFQTYQQSGSFVTFLYHNFGMEKLLALYAAVSHYGNSAPHVYTIFGYTLDDLIDDWQRHLVSTAHNFVNTMGDWWRICLDSVY
ncbi:MAG: hypothetical protein FWC16_05405 [Defluviitaleaceae bacterium]|nr:hypothetical protein [Defluviitaleaceae bacterium]MCL2274345.1 hypothetical protein [Defluviitaleaceae bacterium]